MMKENERTVVLLQRSRVNKNEISREKEQDSQL